MRPLLGCYCGWSRGALTGFWPGPGQQGAITAVGEMAAGPTLVGTAGRGAPLLVDGVTEAVGKLLTCSALLLAAAAGRGPVV